MPIPRHIQLNDKERHITQTLEQFTRRSGERALLSKVLEGIDWSNFEHGEIHKALESLTLKELIKKDERFITRLWS